MKLMLKSLLSFVFGLAVVLPYFEPAFAEDAWVQEAQHHMDLFDTNRDGSVSRDEWQGAGDKFNRLDLNRDGVATHDEFFNADEWRATAQTAVQQQPAFQPRRLSRRRSSQSAFGQYDLNGDGSITSNEWRGSPWSFWRYDSNRDGALSPQEVSQWGSQSRSGSWDDRRRYGPSRLSRPWVQDAQHHMAMFDTNGDGLVTRGEWQGAADKFSRLDSNADGVLNRNEFFRPEEWSSTQYADQAWVQEAQHHLSMFDANRDGFVTRGEWQGSSEKFARLDNNRDGVLTRDEFFRADEWQANSAGSTTQTTASGDDSNSLEQLLLRLFNQ